MATAVKTTKNQDHADKKASASMTGRPATDPAGPTGRLATWLAEVTLDDVPASVREHAKHLLLDGVACALVGAQLPVSRKGVEAITTLDDAGSAELIGWDGLSTSAPSAAMLNSSFIQGFELDDYHPLAPLHSNSLVIPAMLAAAPHVGKGAGVGVPVRRAPRVRDGPTRGRGATRSGNALPRLALGRCFRHPLRRRGR